MHIHFHGGASLSEQTITVSIDQDHHGQRLDKVLAEDVQTVSRSRIKALIESGNVALDGETIKDPNFRVKQGSTVSLWIPAPITDTPLPQPIPLSIVFEDDHLIVVDKPAGLVVHPAAGNPDKTLVNALLSHCGESLQGIGGVKRPGIVHRLDKDTSGLLVAAKTDVAHQSLTAQFSEHSIERLYTALVWGVLSPLSGSISGAIGRSAKNRKKMAVVARGGKPAVTHYRVTESFGTLASLMECQLETGRTHQIRVHLAHSGHSVVGDPLYGRSIRRGTGASLTAAVKTFNRQALHAGVLGFTHPFTGRPVKFTSDVPTDLETVIAAFRVATSERV